MPARECECEVKSLIWLTPSVFSLTFVPTRAFHYEPGQFLSVILPKGEPEESARGARRIYSFSSPGRGEGYELCVQLVPDGRGSTYLAGLKPGDLFRVAAPFGDFCYETPPARNACFIATGTGIGPFKSMVMSERFRQDPPAAALLLFGARGEKDILFPGLFESLGVEVVECLSRPSPDWTGFKGRITEYLASLPDAWPWQETEFYLCGNGHMIDEVRQHLLNIRRVPARAVRQEAYFSAAHVLRFPDVAAWERKKIA